MSLGTGWHGMGWLGVAGTATECGITLTKVIITIVSPCKPGDVGMSESLESLILENKASPDAIGIPL